MKLDTWIPMDVKTIMYLSLWVWCFYSAVLQEDLMTWSGVMTFLYGECIINIFLSEVQWCTDWATTEMLLQAVRTGNVGYHYCFQKSFYYNSFSIFHPLVFTMKCKSNNMNKNRNDESLVLNTHLYWPEPQWAGLWWTDGDSYGGV